MTTQASSASPLDIPVRAQPAATENKMNHWFQTCVICSTVWAAGGGAHGMTLAVIWGVFAVVVYRDDQRERQQNKASANPEDCDCASPGNDCHLGDGCRVTRRFERANDKVSGATRGD